MKTVAYFGNYNPTHPRNVIFIECLKLAGYNILEINCREKGIGKYFKLIKELSANKDKIDYLMVGFPGQAVMIMAKMFFRGPIIFNVLLSLYDSIIIDRRLHCKFSPTAIHYWILDFISVRLADCVILDCQSYIDFFVKKFKVKKDKFQRIFLGANENIFKPLEMPEDNLEIHYYSTFIPTHGADVIIKAAKILENEGIKFVISGRGQCYEPCLKLYNQLSVKNIKFIERLKNVNELNKFINSSFVCLGLFGDNPRLDRCISSKVFEALSCAKPIITSFTLATNELLKDQKDVLFVKPNNPEDLAEKILLLKNNQKLRKKIALNGQRAYKEKASFRIISKQLKDTLEKYHEF